jgi:hypothetical protein
MKSNAFQWNAIRMPLRDEIRPAFPPLDAFYAENLRLPAASPRAPLAPLQHSRRAARDGTRISTVSLCRSAFELRSRFQFSERGAGARRGRVPPPAARFQNFQVLFAERARNGSTEHICIFRGGHSFRPFISHRIGRARGRNAAARGGTAAARRSRARAHAARRLPAAARASVCTARTRGAGQPVSEDHAREGGAAFHTPRRPRRGIEEGGGRGRFHQKGRHEG